MIRQMVRFFLLYLVSVLSNSKVHDKSNSMISNLDIWNQNKSQDDSKQFIENFIDINEKKKKSQFDKFRKKTLTKKPNHLTVINFIILDTY